MRFIIVAVNSKDRFISALLFLLVISLLTNNPYFWDVWLESEGTTCGSWTHSLTSINRANPISQWLVPLRAILDGKGLFYIS